MFSTFTTWICSLLIEHITENKIKNLSKIETNEEKNKTENKFNRLKKLTLGTCICLNIGVLAYIKYFAIIEKALSSLHLNFNLINVNAIIVTIGISFYTFQSLAYLIDVSRETIKAEKNLFKYALFTSFFPQILQGPIHRYSELAEQLYKPKSFCFDDFVMGFERMALGFFKKIFVATQIDFWVNAMYCYKTNVSGAILLLATILFGIQFYADFSGYVDIALGTGKMFRLNLRENFNTPYFACSVRDFWRRWHMSLSVWFKDYLFYPILYTCTSSKLYGKLEKSFNRNLVKRVTVSFALFITWFLIGLWHDCSANFIIYGLYFGFFMILSVLFAKQFSTLKKIFKINDKSIFWKSFQISRTFLITIFGYVLFKSFNLTDAIYIYKKIFTQFNEGGTFNGLLNSQITWIENNVIWSWKMIILGILIMLIIEIANYKGNALTWLHKQNKFVRWSIVYSLILLTLLSMINDVNTSKLFIYSRF
ncbi:MAG: hypothetical protein MJ229_00270 [bacterium]|nr:hypothetical protein [bacterium]